MDYYSRKRQKRRVRLALWLACIGTALFLVNLYFAKHVNPLVIDATRLSVDSTTYQLMTESAYTVLAENPTYSILAEVSTDSAGRITMISHKQSEINMFALKTVQLFLARLGTAGEGGVAIPIGTFTGVPIFSAQGTNVNIKYKPQGTARCEILSEFTSAGINQTSHKIYFVINATILTMVPATRERIEITHTVLVSESIVIGDVPNLYIGSTSLGKLTSDIST